MCAVRPGSVVQLDWHSHTDASAILHSLCHQNTYRRRQFGLLERPTLPQPMEEVQYKVMVCGKAGIGKSTVISRLSGVDTPTVYRETPGIQSTVVYWPVKLVHVGKLVMFRIHLWEAGDTAASKFDHVLPACQEGVDGFIFVFSYSERASLDSIPQQMSRAIPQSQRACAVVVGTRLEQLAESEVSQRDVREFEQRWQVPVTSLRPSTHSQGAHSRTQQKAELHEVALVLNVLCEQLWVRDHALGGYPAVAAGN